MSKSRSLASSWARLSVATTGRSASSVTRFLGLKPPRFPTIWEAAVNGIACQQLSLTVWIMLLNRLWAACGRTLERGNGPRSAFPRSENLAAVPETVRSLRFSAVKPRALIDLCHESSANRLAALDNSEAVSRPMDLRSVGRWTAEYTLLREMGRLDLFL